MYCKKVFLTKDHHPSTSTVVCYDGPSGWPDKDRPELKDKFVEVGSCHEKIRLHQMGIESDSDFLDKVVRLRDELNCFISYLTGE